MSHLKEITRSLGSELTGKRIALCVTASVSVTEAPRIARLLMRHGAEVIPVLTSEAAKLVSPTIFEWSTGNKPITEITGRVEHVELVTFHKVDLVLVAPCTANTVAKIATGISDDPVSLLACTAFGAGIPLLLAPAMHEPMLGNPILIEQIRKLKSVGVHFVQGEIVENKSKLALPEEIVAKVIELLSSSLGKSSDSQTGRDADFSAYNILVTAGPTREPIDEVRFITNSSSGKMGIAIVQLALDRGARVTLICSDLIRVPSELASHLRLKTVRISTTNEMLEAATRALKENQFDFFISAAAPSDYSLSDGPKGKISTRDSPVLNLELRATKKIISEVKRNFPMVTVVAFKAEFGLDEDELIRKARITLEESHADMIVANDISRKDIGFGSDYNEAIIIPNDGMEVKKIPRMLKNEMAGQILDCAVNLREKTTTSSSSIRAR